MKKFLNTRGETLIETMAAMIVIMLGLTMLAGALLASGKVNQQAAQQVSSVKSAVTPFVLPTTAPETPYSVMIKSGGATPGASTPTPIITIPVHVLQRGEGGSVVYSYERIATAPAASGD